MAKASALEACAGAGSYDGWTFDVVTDDGVWFTKPGLSVEQHLRAVEAARAVFKANGITPQGAAIGDWERQVYELHAFQGPEPSEESNRAADIFWDAQEAARNACGGDAGSTGYMVVTGTDAPYWQGYMAQSKVLNFDPNKELAEAV